MIWPFRNFRNDFLLSVAQVNTDKISRPGDDFTTHVRQETGERSIRGAGV